jgi:predicted DCC family thiol-disulfide oxidoreductase YuxK|tara:strand:- start:1658 stop:2038 length:381 start_codon:yes stop_codon:yes gene_type:complete
MTKQIDNWIIYDGECPFCSRYVKLMRLEETIGDIRLIDARKNPPELNLLKEKNLDINRGMAIFLNEQLYFGADCINRLALLSSPIGLVNKLNYYIFNTPLISRMLYPVLRIGRNIVIHLLGKGFIK